MCDFISWIEQGEKILFLTDTEVFSRVGEEKLAGTAHNDVFGHGAIRIFYGLKPGEGIQQEDTEFWEKNLFPKEIAKYLKSPKIMLATWGRMLKIGGAIDAATAYHILVKAPESWRKALSDICINVISQTCSYSYDAFNYSYDAINHFDWLSRTQRNKLIEGVSRSPNHSFSTLLTKSSNLTRAQKNELVAGISTSDYYSRLALGSDIIGLTEVQKKKLVASAYLNHGY